MPKISVIVPVFNSQKYLPDCLDSLRRQSFADIEIVCVDDGSTDASADILTSYAAEDGRMKVLRKENGGPSSARNLGLEAAGGDYLCFLDADDSFEPTTCSTIVEAFESCICDVVVFGGTCLPKKGADRRIVTALSPRAAYYPSFDPALLFHDRTHPYIRFAIRRDFLQARHIRFDEELRVGEEEALVFNLFPAARGVKVIPDKLYNYVQFHEGSQMQEATVNAARQCTVDQGVAEHVFRDCSRNNLISAYPAEMFWWSVRFSVYSVLRQEPAVRNPLVRRVRKMWLDNCTDGEILAAARDKRLAPLIEAVLDAAKDGTPTMGDAALARALRIWRLAEYGYLDAARTALERIPLRKQG